MLKFEFSLSYQQVQMLLAFIDLENKGKLDKSAATSRGTVATARGLLAEGLITCEKSKRTGEPGKWTVTRKGYMAANLVQEEMASIRKLPKRSGDYSLVFYYDLPPGLTTSSSEGLEP